MFTIPKMLRIYFLRHRELLGALSLAAYQTVKELMAAAAVEEKDFRPGYGVGGPPTAAGFGTLMQQIDAADYRGRRVRLSGLSKAAAVAGWAGLWMRVDGRRGVLAFDNMQSRPSPRGRTRRGARRGPRGSAAAAHASIRVEAVRIDSLLPGLRG